MLNYVTLVLLKPPKSMPASKYGQQQENGKKNHQKLKQLVKNEKNILEKIRNFQPLMRGTAKQHGFLHIGANLVAKRALGRMGQIHPISTCT